MASVSFLDSIFLLSGRGLLRDFSLRVQDAQPRPVLLHPDIRKIALPWRNFAVPLEDAEGMVRDDRNVSIVIHAEAMPILLHGLHLKNPGLQPSLNLGFSGAASIDIRLGDVLGV